MAAPNSSIPGYLLPTSTGGDLNDDALDNFLQGVVVGITGIVGPSVRPRWQPEPPNMPPRTDWAAIGVMSSRPDTFATVVHRSLDGGFDEVYRQDILEILCTFYGPSSRGNCNLLSMGFQVAQNLENMKTQGFGFISCDRPLYTAELKNEVWIHRVDLTFYLRRPQIYVYPVLNLDGAVGTVNTDTGLPPAPINANIHTVVKPPQFAWDIEAEFLAGWDQASWA